VYPQNQQYLVTKTFAVASGGWTGCDWTTKYGEFELNLKGLRARQTRVLSEATSGLESECWENASRWLAQVEKDARAAESAAKQAVQHVETQEMEAAVQFIQMAISLEAKYRSAKTWAPLAAVISDLHRESLANNEGNAADNR
jgi:hypothetical protein